jgi:hypothetical protein
MRGPIPQAFYRTPATAAISLWLSLWLAFDYTAAGATADRKVEG